MRIERLLPAILVVGALLLATGNFAPSPLSAAEGEARAADGGGVIDSGRPVSQWFPISPLDASELGEVNSAVAYNSWWHEYLVVWARGFASGESYIYGQFVSRNGTLIGSRFLIPGLTGSCGEPDVAYNPARNEYLVVYGFSSPVGYGLYGLRLDAFGSPLGAQLSFAWSTTDWYGRPAVAYAIHSNEYLVVWERAQGVASRGIEARSLSGDGATMSDVLAVTGMSADVEPAMPDVAYTRASDEFLVVWQRWYDSNHTDHDVMGQRIGLTGGIHTIGPVIPIYNTSNDECNPAVASVPRLSGVGEYLIACEYVYGGSAHIAGQLMTDSGTLHDFGWISPYAGSMPAVASNENTREFLVAWRYGSNIQARTVTTAGGLGPDAQPMPYGSNPAGPAIAGGPLGDYLVTCHDQRPGYNSDIFGFLWGNRVFLPLVQRH